MDVPILKIWPRALAVSFVVALLTGLASIAMTGPGRFLGADFSGVAAGIAGFYPGTAALELAKLFGAVWAAWLAVTVLLMPRRARARTAVRRALVYPLAPLAAHAMWIVATTVKYPALFEGSLPYWARRMVFQTSFYAPPGIFAAMALLLLVAPLYKTSAQPTRQKRLVTALATGMAIVAMLVSAKEPPGMTMPPQGRPHVVFIAIDSLRFDRLAEPRVLPHISALLADAQTISFEDHHVGVPRTFPSWVEMLEGRYAPRNGVRHMFPSFSERHEPFVGLGTAMKESGYRTHVVSDFAGDIFPRFDAGFDTIDTPKLTLQTMIRMSIDQLVPAYLPVTTTLPNLFPDLKESPAFADPAHLTDKVLGALSEQPSPIFLTAFYSTAHFPYAAPFPYYSFFSRKDYAGSFFFQKNPELASEPVARDPNEVSQVRALYDGALRGIDDQIGRIFASIKRAGLWDQTLIVITADHGEDLFEPGVLQGHGEHLRGRNVLQVPLVMKLPVAAGRPASRTFKGLSRSIDIASTVAAASGLATDAIGDGTNLLPWMTGARRDEANLSAYAETEIWFARSGAGFFQEKRLDYPGIAGLLSFDQGYTGEIVLSPVYEDVLVAAKHRMLIKGDHKIIYMPTPRGVEWELYDRRRDPANAHEISANEPAVFEGMKTALLAEIARLESRHRLSGELVVPR